MDFIDHRSTAQFTFLTSATDEKIRINADGDLLVGISTPFDTSGITLDATGALGVDGHITVATGATYDIGTATNKFRDLYLSGDINVAGASTSGDLTVGGSLSVTTDATVTGSLTVSTDATITNDLTVSNDATVSGDLTVSTNAVIAGDLTVNGTTTTINTETLDVKDKNITLNYGGDTTSADGAGITIEDAVGAGIDATILWDGSSDTFDFSHAIDVTGTITADNNLTIQNSSAYGSIELGGVSGGFIDIKRPFSDDYDLRLIAEGDGGVINVASGELTIQRAGSAKLATTSTGIDVTGDITVSGTVDGRDVVTDGTKLDTVETNADVTDTVNVTAAGALMDSEVTNLAQVKAFDSADYATAAQGSTADSAMQDLVDDATPQLGGNLDLNSNNITGTGNIDVTGSISADGLTVDGSAAFNLGAGEEVSIYRSTDYAVLRLGASSTDHWSFQEAGTNSLYIGSTDSGTAVSHLKLDNNGDISFYEDTGTTAKLFWDASTEFLGLGSTAPAAKLDIVDTSADVQMRVYKNDGTKNTRVTVTADDSGAKIHYRDADNAGALRFNNNLGEVMRITADTTSVGIGTSSPAQTLHLKSANPVIRLEDSNPDGIYAQIDGAGGSLILSADQGNGSANSNIVFKSDNAERLRIDANGNVGIGRTPVNTLNPSLELVDGGSLFGFGKSLYLTANLYYAGGWKAMATGAGASYVFDSSHKFYTNASVSANATATPVERLRIDSAGRVGLGTSSPAENLHISSSSGSARIRMTSADGSDNMIVFGDASDSATGAIRFDHSDNSLAFYGFNNTERMRIDSSGNVGIGRVSSSVVRLSVRGSDAGSSNYAFEATDSAYATRFIVRNDGQSQFFKSDNSASMTITNAGNVGIGTDSPATKLEITGTADAETGVTTTHTRSGVGYTLILDNLTNSASNGSGVKWRSGGFDTGAIITRSDSTAASNDAPAFMTFHTSDDGTENLAERMRIDSSGNLLVGQTSATPHTNYTTAGSAYMSNGQIRTAAYDMSAIELNRTHSDGDIAVFRKQGTTVGSVGSTSGSMYIQGNPATGKSGLTFYGSSIEPRDVGAAADAAVDLGASGTRFKDLHLSGTANVGTSLGIGTSSIIGKLHANDSGGATVTLTRTSGATSGNLGKLRFGNTDIDSDLASIVAIQDGATNNSALTFGTQTAGAAVAERMRIDSSGNLLVGTTTTTAGNEGMVYFNGSSLRVTRDSDEPLNLDRLTTNGSLVDFKKDGTTVGSIGSYLGAYAYIGSTGGTDTHIGFVNGAVRPHRNWCGIRRNIRFRKL